VSRHKLLIDGREFVPGKRTGIGRFLEGLLDALMDSELDLEVFLAVSSKDAIPPKLRDEKKTKTKTLPAGFLASEKALTDLTKESIAFLLSPYPKLPLLGSYCPAINTIHDVLDLTHPAYKKRVRTFFDRFRLKLALRKASLTWYDSRWSLRETENCVGFVGKNPRVRYLAIDESFKESTGKNDHTVLRKHQLAPGYVIAIGNGLPHKNLGAILTIANSFSRQIVFVGVSEKNQTYWQSRYQNVNTSWIAHVSDEDLPALIRGAFCLVQPSTAEGYGYPPLEAMACGIPAIVSEVPVLLETTGSQALSADPHSPKSWLQVMEALEDENVYQNQVQKGLQWVEPMRGHKGWEKHLSDVDEFLKGM
jgi:glycosyltransferase involved in cell wall biosynthesis